MTRDCGECNTCCIITEINEGGFFKPAGEKCKYLCEKKCSVFGKKEKPATCTNYNCSWIYGYGKEEDRPDKSDVMISISSFNNGTWIFVMETKQFAFLTTGKNIIIDIANKLDMPIIISEYKSEFGKDFGDYVLVKDKIDSKCSRIKGDFISDYAENLKLYKLIIH